jgi:hypothetical protein
VNWQDINPLARAPEAKPIWPRVVAWLVEEEPESFSRPLLDQPLPKVDIIQAPEPPPPPSVSHIYVRERGSGVFIPFAVFPEDFHPEDHGGLMAADTAVLRIELPVDKVLGLMENSNCLRGFVDSEILALREMRRMDVTEEGLTKHLRDK